MLEGLTYIGLVALMNLGTKAHGLVANSILYDFVDAVKGTPTNKENICGINLNEFLVGMLATALGRNAGHSPLKNFEQSLLYAFAGNIPGNGWVLGFTGNLINLIDIDDTLFSLLHIVISRLNKFEQDILHIFAHIASFRQGSGVGNGKGHIQNAGQGLGQQSLAHTGGSQKQNIAFMQFHFIAGLNLNPLVMIVHRHRQGSFGAILANYILVKYLVNFFGLGHIL